MDAFLPIIAIIGAVAIAFGLGLLVLYIIIKVIIAAFN